MTAARQRYTAYTSPNKVQLVRAGKPYFDLLLQLINQAKETIQLQTYIYEADETGLEVAHALIAAATRGVQVYVLVDGYASSALSPQFVEQLKNARINFRFFEPIFKGKSFYIGRRLHHKVLVVDAQYALVGGINISNRYNDMPDNKAWLDFALFTEGAVVKGLCILCWKIWNGFQQAKHHNLCKIFTQEVMKDQLENCLVRMRRNDWVWKKNQVSKTYIQMLRTASSQVIILCSYFLPGRMIRRNIIRANKKGVTIKVIMTGYSDVKIAKNAERFMYDWLLRKNVEIYEYQKNILHGKIAVADGKWATIGSYNVNDISAYASIELNLDVKNSTFAKQVEDTLEAIIKNDCIQITKEKLQLTKNIFKQFIHWCSYSFFRLMFYLFTFYFKEKN